MTQTNTALDDASRAILDGTAVDWEALASSPDPDAHALAEQLRVLAAVATLHRDTPAPPRPSAPARDRLAGLRHWGHLRLDELVGSGAFGSVYRAWDSRLDREVALKLLPDQSASDQFSSRIIEEGRLLARVRHPNVATIYGAEALDGYIGLWMEFIRGRTLEQMLRAGCEFQPSDVLDIGRQLCAAVSAVHEAGLLHRDIKTQNVMRADDGRVVLTDFGTGRDLADAATGMAGTPLYLAPEALAGQPASVQTDVYSIGVVLFRILTGAFPVSARTLDGLRRSHETGARADLDSFRPDIPPTLAAIVVRALHPDPRRRYRTSAALAAALGNVIHPVRRYAWASALVIACLAAVAWSAFFLSPSFRATVTNGRSDTLSWLGFGTPAPVARSSVVVLPFRNLRADTNSDLVVDGLTYELIRSLAIIDGIDVRSATSSFALRGRNVALADVGAQLDVAYVVEGSVSGQEGHWHVQVQFAQVNGDRLLWSRGFDSDSNDVARLQQEIALAVANHLRLDLGGGQRRYDLDPAVYMQYLQARALIERRDTAGPQAAVDILSRIVQSDPSYAPAHAGLVDAYSFMSQSLPDVGGLPSEQATSLMRAATEEALALDPLLAEAHAAKGILASREHLWDDADRSFRRAIELNPALTQSYTAYSFTTLVPMGRFAEAEQWLAEARRRDPLSLDVLRELSFLELVTGRYDQAIAHLEHIRSVDPALPYLGLLLARAQSLAGRYDEAMPYWESVRDQVGSQQWMAYAFVRTGRRAEIERLAALPQHPYRQVLFFAALGDTDRAMAALDQAVDLVPHRVVRLLQYPELAGLRNDPRFGAIRARFGLKP